ncbi:MAG: helix-turn-helix domain-containing protein [Oscillospiraceae bacterium]|nr:helix-turn-helix domain-containing protein [Oscillospiraceae bacterium]
MENEIYKKEQFFHKCSFCKVFAVSDAAPSGYLFHAHEFVQVWYLLRGKCEHYVGDQVFSLDVGDSFLIPPNVSHKTILQPDTSVICCDFDPKTVLALESPEDTETELSLLKVMRFLEESREELPRFRFQQKTRRRVERLMQEMLEEYDQGSFYFEDVLRIKIRELLFLFMREFASTPVRIRDDQIYEKYKSLMAEAIRYIDENYCENLTLSDVCKNFAISKTYFCHLFKLMTEKTFTEYLTDLRIRAAMTMLEDHSRSITEISEKLGFSNTSYFSKIFKKYTGCLPKEYRKERSKRRNSTQS